MLPGVAILPAANAVSACSAEPVPPHLHEYGVPRLRVVKQGDAGGGHAFSVLVSCRKL
jgi:hypothetical protein